MVGCCVGCGVVLYLVWCKVLWGIVSGEELRVAGGSVWSGAGCGVWCSAGCCGMLCVMGCRMCWSVLCVVGQCCEATLRGV